jgi:glycosyltransferase involved in cell wall biosynthesis
VTRPMVSFVIPCYNYGRYLRDCLDAILTLEGGYEIEIIAVNDASPDNTVDILLSYSDPRLKVIDRRENRGHVFTVNEGMMAARGKYVVRIDPDDRHRPCFLVRTIPLLELYSEVGMVYGDVAVIDAAGEITTTRADVDHGGRDFKGNELIALMKKNFVCAPTVIARREAWMSAWPVPEGLAFNDWYFSLMLARSWDFYFVNHVLADYRVHGENHHYSVSRDGSEERSVIWLLDKIYAEPETDPALETAKQAAKAEVYSSQYLDFAIKYFGHEMNMDSRRCFLRVLSLRPSLMLRIAYLRLLVATLVPRRWYNWAKQMLRKIA